MRDYYLEYISDHGRKFEKGSNSQGAKGTEDTFAPSAPIVDCESSKISLNEGSRSIPYTEEEQSIIFEERVAIMMLDGGLSEDDVIDLLTNRQKRTFLAAKSNEPDF